MPRNLVFGLVIAALLVAGVILFLLPPGMGGETAAATPTTDPGIYNQVPETTVFEPGECTVVLDKTVPAHTSKSLGGAPSGEIPAGRYEAGVKATYSTSVWYGLNNVGTSNYVNGGNVAFLEGSCAE